MKTMTQQAKTATGYWMWAIAICLLGTASVGLIFQKAITKDSATQSVEDFGDRSKQGLLNYLNLSCDGGKGSQQSCEEYEKASRQ
jgi:hypothetical protein